MCSFILLKKIINNCNLDIRRAEIVEQLDISNISKSPVAITIFTNNYINLESN